MKKNEKALSRKFTTWNTRKKDGWLKYANKTEDNIELMRAGNIEGENPEEVLKIINNELTKVKFSCFGKVKINGKSKEEKEIESLQSMKMKIVMNEDDKSKDTKLETINNKMVEVLKTIQSKQFTKDINNLEY